MNKEKIFEKDSDIINKIVKYAYASAFLKNEKPISLFLIAPPDHSKTHNIMQYTTKYSYISTDLSYFGIYKLLQKDKKVKHLVIPDFLKITHKGQSTKRATLMTLNGFLEEGLHSINLAGSEQFSDLKGRSGGIITATTTHSFFQSKKEWEGIGFLSRVLFCSYKYTDKTKLEIIRKIRDEEKSNKKKKGNIEKISFATNKTFKIPNEIDNEIIHISEFSFRRFKLLNKLLKTIALVRLYEKTENNKEKRKQKEIKISKDDLEELKRINKYLNLKFKYA